METETAAGRSRRRCRGLDRWSWGPSWRALERGSEGARAGGRAGGIRYFWRRVGRVF